MQTRSPSCPPTWDIIHQYANISVEILENSLDSPENGILLQIEKHRAFEGFEWCFVATVSQGYRAFIRLKLTVAFAGATRRIQREVVSRTPLNLLLPWTFQNQPNQPIIPLPKPEYLALHAAIAHIMHETKLGEYHSTIIDYFLPNSSSMLPGKFNAEDLPLRITLMQILEPTLLNT